MIATFLRMVVFLSFSIIPRIGGVCNARFLGFSYPYIGFRMLTDVSKTTLFCHNLSCVFCSGRHTIGLQTQMNFAAAKPPRVTVRCEQYEQEERGA